MRLGIDWLSLGIFVAAYVFSQIRTIPLKTRYLVSAVAFFAIAGFRLYRGAQGANLAFVVLAAGFAVYYLVRAFSARDG